jgi:penicillin-binding protein 2
VQNPLRNPLSEVGAGRSSWTIDSAPVVRLVVLFALMIGPLAVIAVRLVHVQAGLGEDYLVEVSRTETREEPIPARDARILAEDGTILAADRELFALKVHYRWIEEPPHPLWLKRTAIARLPKSQRKRKPAVEAEIARVLRDRDALWTSLARVTNEPDRELLRRRRDIQRRVERVRDNVLARQASPGEGSASVAASARATVTEKGPWWERVIETLTTPPDRGLDANDLVIEEEQAYHTLFDDLAPEAAVAIESRPDLFPGSRIELTTRRTYPEGSLAAHLIGYRTAAADGTKETVTGLEQAYASTLRGVPGLRQLTVDRRGEIVATKVIREPRPGQDVIIGLDIRAQRTAEELLATALAAPAHVDAAGKPVPQPIGGAIVAIEIESGQLLAAASAPTFSLGLFTDASPGEWERTLADKRMPFFPRATQMALPPGSVFKVVSAVAVVESGTVRPDEPFVCRGYLDKPTQHRCLTFRNYGVGHSEVDLAEALAKSCNVYFFDAARRGGPLPLVTWARRFGFGQPTGIDLGGESSGHLPKPMGGARPSGDTLGLAIGQADLTATPLQIARMMAVIANGGRLVTPHLAVSAQSASSSIRDDGARLDGLRPATLEWVREGLRRVVAEPGGTGYKTVRSPRVSIAGKTGTAEIGGGRPDHAWFAGYAPADHPRVAFVVVLEQAGSGGVAAGPVARQFVEALAEAGLVGSEPLVGQAP